MRPKRFSWVAALFCLVTAGPAWSCRQALVLAVDVSGSVDGVECRERKVRAGLKSALGTALAFAHSMLTQQPACWDHTIDVSADGYNNVGPTPQQIYSSGLGRATVNALVVGKPDENSVEGPGIASDDLLKYFESEVIRGPGAFALYAQGYADYAQAMKKKLEKELKPPVIGLVAPSKATDRFEDS